MNELLVILGTEIILLASLGAMNVWRRRTDVLTGRYFSERQDPSPSVARTVDGLRQRAERERIARRPTQVPLPHGSITRAPRQAGRPARALMMQVIFRRRRQSGAGPGSGAYDVAGPTGGRRRTAELPRRLTAQV